VANRTEGGGMPEIKVNIEIFCDRCGDGLCGNTSARNKSGRYSEEAYFVKPCAKCLKEKYEEGYEEAQKDD
jgi:hypothetical protein